MNDYFYLDSQNRQHGPISPDKFAENGVTPQTLVWCNGMKDWAPAETVPELKDFFTPFAAGPQPPQPPQPPHGGAPYHQAPQPNGYQGQNLPPCPDTHMVAAVLVTICCCLPFGVVAIVKANQVTTFYYQGLYDQAVMASADADKWVKLALLFGIISFCAYGGFTLLSLL